MKEVQYSSEVTGMRRSDVEKATRKMIQRSREGREMTVPELQKYLEQLEAEWWVDMQRGQWEMPDNREVIG